MVTLAKSRGGRLSNTNLVERDAHLRRTAAALLMQALQHLNHPSRLSDSPMCQWQEVRQRALDSPNRLYPRAHVVIDAVRRSHAAAHAELEGTADACCLVALADALQGLTREESARKAGVSATEISRRRREAVEVVIDHVLTLLRTP